MSLNVSDVKSELTAVLHGTTLNQIQSIDAMFDRAARKLLNDLDPIETERIVQLADPIYNQVYDYPIPDDLKGDRIIDIRPQVNRTLLDRFFQRYQADFDLYKTYVLGEGDWSLQFNTAQKSIRIAKNVIPSILVNNVSSIVGNGTWIVGGNGSNLKQDSLLYISGGSSLEIDLTSAVPGTDAYIETADSEPVDLTRDDEQGVEFYYAYIPDTAVVNSYKLRWGSSPTDYWEQTVTANFFGNAFQVGWNLLKFDWSSATVVGSPDATQVRYLRLTVNNTGVATAGFRFNNLVSQLGQIYEILYYSKYLFRDAITGAFQERVTDDSNIINLDTDSYNMFFNLVAYFAVQQQKSVTGQFDASFFLNEYEKEKKRYVAKIRSQVQKPQDQYYKMPPKITGITRPRMY